MSERQERRIAALEADLAKLKPRLASVRRQRDRLKAALVARTEVARKLERFEKWVRGHLSSYRAKVEGLNSNLADARARLKELEEALRPFAELFVSRATSACDSPDPDDVYRARKALGMEEP